MKLANKLVISALGLFLLASCASAPVVTRANIQPDLAQLQDLSGVSAQFHREVAATIHFKFDKDTLTQEAMAQLNKQGKWIMQYPEIRFSVYGHTDKVGDHAYNEDLGMRRATRVVAYLVSLGVNGDRLEAMVSYGEDLPVVKTQNRELANRRTITTVAGYFAPAIAERQARSKPGTPTTPAVTPPTVTPPTVTPPTVTPPVVTPPTTTPPTVTPPTVTPPTVTPPTEDKPKKAKRTHVDAGRGNGAETGDPGKSAGRNKGGDAD